MQELKIVDVNGEAGVGLPDEVLQRWGLQLGDEIEAVVENGQLVILSPVRPVLAATDPLDNFTTGAS